MFKQNPFSSKVDKYWELRETLFSRFDEGILIDEEGLYSVQSENIALEIAKTLPGDVVLDCFGCVGGSAIAFARMGKKVLSVELDENRVNMAINNARIYGVEDKITFIKGDILELIHELEFDSIYLDPPWGGVDYIKKTNFGFDDFTPNGFTLLELAFSRTNNVAFSLPINFNLGELNKFGMDYFLQKNILDSIIVHNTVYFGLKINKNNER